MTIKKLKLKKKSIQELLENPIEDWKKEVKTDFYNIHYRSCRDLKTLKKEDYIRGFGFNINHYRKVCKAREELGLPLRSDFEDSYEHKSRDGGYYITGDKIVSKYHPLHDKMLVNRKTGIRYHIDVVSIKYHYGMILSLSTREEGTKSHGCKDWEIITGGNEDTVERIEDNHNHYKLEDIKK